MNLQQFNNQAAHERFNCEQSLFIGEKLKHAPAMFHRQIESRFNWKLKTKGLQSANLDLISISERLKRADISLTLSDDDICDRAERYAKECSMSIAAGGLFSGRAYAEARGGKLPKKCTEAGEVARLSDSLWWRRQLRVKHGRAVEGEALTLNLVNRKAEIYASNASVTRRKTQKKRNRRILEEVIAVNELGQEYTLAELSELGVSNPAIRRGELMTRIAGFEQYAQKHGHIGVFWTITCPSKMHSALSKTGKRNPNYDGTTPKQAQAYLSKVWARVRAKFARENIEVYGMRVAEPQHDGTPHWHMLVFLGPEIERQATEIYMEYALKNDGQEPGANKYRFDRKIIDWKKGTAAGYIAKYIAKNIDAYGVDYDLYGKDADKSVARVDAWASTWGIRQFQQVGGPSVTVWRELRRMGADSVNGEHIDKHRTAADCGDWFAYIEQMKKRPVTLLKVWNDKPGRYVEPVGDQIIGVELSGGFEYITRLHNWSIKHGSKKEEKSNKEINLQAGKASLVEIYSGGDEVHSLRKVQTARRKGDTEGLILSGGFLPPWSSVNNCTLQNNNNNNKSLKTAGGFQHDGFADTN